MTDTPDPRIAVITRIDEGVILRPRDYESFADFYFRIMNRRRRA